MLEAITNWDKLSPEKRNALRWVFLRPTDPGGGYDSNQHLLPTLYGTTNFVFHYTIGTDGGAAADVPDLTDSDFSGVPDYIEDYASYFETSYGFQTVTRSFSPPPSDAAEPNDGNNRNPDGRYDVFVYDLGSGLYGVTYPKSSTSPTYSYIDVNKDYNWAPANDDPEGSAKGAMKVTAAHEFHHAIQFTYDVQEDVWWMETTATYMEDEVYPVVNDNYTYLDNWFEFSDTYGLTTFNGSHEYGNFIWAKRLSEDFGDDIIYDIWVEDQTADGLTAIDNVLQTRGSDLVDEFNSFGVADFFLEDSYVDGADYRSAVAGTTYGGVWIEYEYDAATDGLPFTIDSTNVSWDAWMDTWAADYITFGLDPATSDYWLFFDGLDTAVNYQVKLATKKGASISEQRLTLDAARDGWAHLPYDAYDDAVLVMENAGNTACSSPCWEVTITSTLPPDNDGDGVPDFSDNCPAWPNTDQSLPPWTVPADDSDCDGFMTADESSMGTDPLVACGAAAWPPDTTDDQVVDFQDLNAIVPFLFQPLAGNERYNLSVDGAIDLQDLNAVVPFLFQSCTPP